MKKKNDADYRLAETMLSNIYLIPYLLGNPIDRVDMWHSSNYEDPETIEWLPEEIQTTIIEDDLSWIRDKYESVPFQRVLNRHIEIYKELQNTPLGEKRTALVGEGNSLLDGWR